MNELKVMSKEQLIKEVKTARQSEEECRDMCVGHRTRIKDLEDKLKEATYKGTLVRNSLQSIRHELENLGIITGLVDVPK